MWKKYFVYPSACNIWNRLKVVSVGGIFMVIRKLEMVEFTELAIWAKYYTG